jgi:hypothetical protein
MAVTPVKGKFGSSKALFLVSGYNMLAAKLEGLRYKIESLIDRTDGEGDAWEEYTPNGVSKAEVAQEGGYFDTAAGSSHEALKDSAGAARVVCLGLGGNAIGQPFVGFQGVYQQDYEVLSKRGALTRANASYVVSGRADQGSILHALTAETTDPATTEPGNAVDNTADPAQRAVPITSSSVAATSTITCPCPHGLATGDTVLISGHTGSTPSINGEQTATVTGPLTFTIPVNVTIGGTGGSFVRGKTNAGGAGYLQVSSVTLGGFTNVLVKIRHSSDGAVFADLITFTAVTARASERIEVASAVNRYLSVTADFVGAGAGQSCTFFAGFARF